MEQRKYRPSAWGRWKSGEWSRERALEFCIMSWVCSWKVSRVDTQENMIYRKPKSTMSERKRMLNCLKSIMSTPGQTISWLLGRHEDKSTEVPSNSLRMIESGWNSRLQADTPGFIKGMTGIFNYLFFSVTLNHTNSWLDFKQIMQMSLITMLLERKILVELSIYPTIHAFIQQLLIRLPPKPLTMIDTWYIRGPQCNLLL